MRSYAARNAAGSWSGPPSPASDAPLRQRGPRVCGSRVAGRRLCGYGRPGGLRPNVERRERNPMNARRARFVVEADGGSRGNPGPAGYGALVRDATTGRILSEVAEALGRTTNNVAEYRGLIAGLRAAAKVSKAASVEVRMDSKLVVEQMSGRWKIKHPDMRPLAARAAETARALGRVSYTWVPRSR